MNEHDKEVIAALLERVDKYVDDLHREAEVMCDWKSGLRIAGAVDALEALCLIDKEKAERIRNLAGVFSQQSKEPTLEELNLQLIRVAREERRLWKAILEIEEKQESM